MREGEERGEKREGRRERGEEEKCERKAGQERPGRDRLRGGGENRPEKREG